MSYAEAARALEIDVSSVKKRARRRGWRRRPGNDGTTRVAVPRSALKEGSGTVLMDVPEDTSADSAELSLGKSPLTNAVFQALRGQISALESLVSTLRDELAAAKQAAAKAEERTDQALADLRNERRSTAEERLRLLDSLARLAGEHLGGFPLPSGIVEAIQADLELEKEEPPEIEPAGDLAQAEKRKRLAAVLGAIRAEMDGPAASGGQPELGQPEVLSVPDSPPELPLTPEFGRRPGLFAGRRYGIRRLGVEPLAARAKPPGGRGSSGAGASAADRPRSRPLGAGHEHPAEAGNLPALNTHRSTSAVSSGAPLRGPFLSLRRGNLAARFACGCGLLPWGPRDGLAGSRRSTAGVERLAQQAVRASRRCLGHRGSPSLPSGIFGFWVGVCEIRTRDVAPDD